MAERCTARAKRTGDRCRKYPIRGANVCAHHGGSAPQVREAARRRLEEAGARKVVDRYGIPVETTPEEALLGQVWEAAGNVELLRSLVAELPVTSGGIYGLTGSSTKVYEAAPHVLVRMYDEERDRLVRFSSECARVGISERLVRLAERQGEMVAEVIQAVLSDRRLALTKPQREVAPLVVREHLVRVASGAAA